MESVATPDDGEIPRFPVPDDIAPLTPDIVSAAMDELPVTWSVDGGSGVAAD